MADEDSPNTAMLTVVRQFATQLAELKQQEQIERVDLRKDVEAQMTAVRHDVYGSILYLEQQFVALLKTNEDRYKETIDYRAREQAERKAGQRATRVLLGAGLVLSLLIGGIVIALAVRFLS